jgi:Sec-independent protein translocase protein TatA
MNILGVGPAELVLIFIIMLMVAGPKRMIRWSYLIGRYLTQFRSMFQDAWVAVQREIQAEAGDALKDLPKLPTSTKFNPMNELRNAIQKEINPVPTVEKTTTNKANGTEPDDQSDDEESSKYGAWKSQ